MIIGKRIQKQPPDVFCKKRCSEKYCKIHRKTPVPESLFLIKFHASACNFIKKETLAQVFSYEFCEIPKNTFSLRTLLSDCFWGLQTNISEAVSWRCSLNSDVLNFAKFTGKHLCQSLLFDKVAVFRLQFY